MNYSFYTSCNQSQRSPSGGAQSNRNIESGKSFGRTTMGIKSLKMLLMSFPNNLPRHPVCPILWAKLLWWQWWRLRDTGSSRGRCSSTPLCCGMDLVRAQGGKMIQKVPCKVFPALLKFSCRTVHGENHRSPLKQGQIFFMKNRSCSGLKMVLPEWIPL